MQHFKFKPTIIKCSYHHLYQDPCALFTYLLSGIPNRSALDFVYIVACLMSIMIEICLIIYAGIMLYAFQPLLCQKLCCHNCLKPSRHAWFLKVAIKWLLVPHKMKPYNKSLNFNAHHTQLIMTLWRTHLLAKK